MEEPDSPAYFARFRSANESKIDDYNPHFEVFEKTASLRNKMLAQRILESGVEMGHIKFAPITETASLFDDQSDIVYLNLMNVLKSKESVRLAFIKEHHQRIFDIFTKFEDKNIRMLTLLNMITLKSLPFAIVSEEGNLSAAERMGLIYISSLKSLADALRQQRLSSIVTLVLNMFIGLYETVVEPVYLADNWNDHIALNYLLGKLQTYALDMAGIFAENHQILDLQNKTALLYLVSLSLTYEKRYFEERMEGEVNLDDFAFYKSRKSDVSEIIRVLNSLLPNLKKLDFGLVRRLAKVAFYMRECVQSADDRLTMSRLTLDLVINNSSQGAFKLCFPQVIGPVVNDLPIGADEYIDRLLTHGFHCLRDGFLNDNLAALSTFCLLILCERCGIERLLRVPEIFRPGSKLGDSPTSVFQSMFFNVFVFYAIQSKTGLFFKNNFDVFSELLKTTKLSSFAQVALIRTYLEQLLAEVPEEVIAYLAKHKLAAIDVKEHTLYYLALTNSVFKAKYSQESIPDNLVEVVRSNVMEYNKLLAETVESPKLSALRVFYHQVRKFCFRIEKAFPAQHKVISETLKNFCANQKDNLQQKNKKPGPVFKTPTGDCEIVPAMFIFSPQYSCPETGFTLTTLLLLNSRAIEKGTHYLTNGNCTASLFSSQFKISPAYEVTGIADPIQLCLEIMITHGELFIRTNLYNASSVLIKDLLVIVGHAVDRFKMAIDSLPIDNFPPASKKNFNLKFGDASPYDFRIECKIQIQKIDYQERNLLQEEAENDNNKIEDSFGSDDEMNRVYTINCEAISVPFVFFFQRVAEAPADAFAFQFAKKAFHLKLRVEFEYGSLYLTNLADHLGVKLEKGEFVGLFRHFAKSTFFMLRTSYSQQKDGTGLRERLAVRVKTHSKSVIREFKRYFDMA